MGEVALRFVQAGLEATKGTPVNATRILLARITNPNFNKPREFVEEDRGTLVGSQRFNDGVKDYTFSIEGPANYEQIGWFFATAVKGSVVATTINTAAKQYVYTPQTTATGDDLQSATIEFGDNTQEFESEYCEATGFTLGFDTLAVGQAAPVNMTTNYLTQSLTSNTKTAGLTPPATVNSILATGANWYTGSTSTAFGSLAELPGSLRSFNLDYQNGLGRKVFVGDGDTYSNIGRGRRVITFTAMVEGNADGVTRFVEWDLGTEKRQRLRFQGGQIAGASPATTYKLIIDGRFVLTAFNPIGVVDTNTVFEISGRFLPDSTISDSDLQITLVNLEASYT